MEIYDRDLPLNTMVNEGERQTRTSPTILESFWLHRMVECILKTCFFHRPLNCTSGR